MNPRVSRTEKEATKKQRFRIKLMCVCARAQHKQKDETIKRGQARPSVRGCDEENPSKQGQPRPPYFNLGNPGPRLDVKVCTNTLRTGPVCAQKRERDETTRHEGRKDMKRKKKRKVREG